MEYGSVLDQQSISGENLSLILCVWKPGYMKFGHIYIFIFHTLPCPHRCLFNTSLWLHVTKDTFTFLLYMSQYICTFSHCFNDGINYSESPFKHVYFVEYLTQ